MLLIKNGRVMDPKSGLDQVCDVLVQDGKIVKICLLYTSPSPRDVEESRMPSSA